MYLSGRASSTPMSKPPAMVSGNEENPPSNAADNVGTMVSVSDVGSRLLLITEHNTTPAPPDNAPPSAQLPAATRPGDQPVDAVTRSLSETAAVATPKLLHR